MFSTQGLNQRVILFVGRPTDSRKGLCLLFEAISVLSSLSDLPLFALWIIGGSLRECGLINKLIESQVGLKRLKDQGRLLVWGRVENSTLAEFYARATVTIVPSHREEFGIVAVEAMMSGCPVIAARTGGLQDIVGHNSTGFLFESDDMLGLATAISSYIRNSEMAKLHGRNAQQRAESLFGRDNAYSNILSVYQPTFRSLTDLEEVENTRGVAPRVTPDKLQRLREIFRQDLESVVIPAHGKHPVIIFEIKGERLVAKFFNARASLQSSVFPQEPSLEAQRGGMIAYARTLYNNGNPVAPAIVYSETHPLPLVITKWYQPFESPRIGDSDSFILLASQSCQQYKPVPLALRQRYVHSLRHSLSKNDAASIREFDIVSSELNSELTGGVRVFCRTHPQIELRRLRLLMEHGCWLLPTEFKVRAMFVIDTLLHEQEPLSDTPTLANADPKADHMLRAVEGGPILADFEHSRYAVGPLDVAAWICVSGVRAVDAPNAQSILKRIEALFSEQSSRYACVSWIVVESLFITLLSLSQGNRRDMIRTSYLFREMPMHLLACGFIR